MTWEFLTVENQLSYLWLWCAAFVLGILVGRL